MFEYILYNTYLYNIIERKYEFLIIEDTEDEISSKSENVSFDPGQNFHLTPHLSSRPPFLPLRKIAHSTPGKQLQFLFILQNFLKNFFFLLNIFEISEKM